MSVGKPLQTKVCVRSAMRHEKRLRRRIMRAAAAGGVVGVKHALRQYLSSHDAKLAATLEAWKKMPDNERPPRSVIPEIAAKIDPWRGTDEEVRLWLKPKRAQGQFRPIMSFGIENRARQYLVLRALKACARTRPDQFAGRGGRDAAIARVVEHLEAGLLHAVECDIINCFGSFDEERVPDHLPLPRAVTANVVVAKNLNVSGKTKKDGPPGANPLSHNVPNQLGDGADDGQQTGCTLFDTEAARRGIPQGAATSPLVAEILLALVIDALPNLGAVVNYSDNFLLLAKDANDVVAMSNALGKLLTECPVGPLEPSFTPFLPGDAITFLGYAIHGHGSEFEVTPSQRNMDKFRDKFRSKCKWIKKAKMSEAKTRKSLRQLQNYVKGWAAAFSMWDGAEAHRKKYLAKVRALSKEQGLTFSSGISKFLASRQS